MRKNAISVVTLGLVVILGGSAWAGGALWRDHAPPFGFLFGNHIDTHQQTRAEPSSDLFGFLYVEFTGEVSPEGIPKARHCDASTPAKQCVAGWIVRGKLGSATFVSHGMDHPIWLVDSRSDIPQPGAFSHFHWLGLPAEADGLVPGASRDGFFLELQATDTFFFLHAGQEILVRPGIDISTHVNIVSGLPEIH